MTKFFDLKKLKFKIKEMIVVELLITYRIPQHLHSNRSERSSLKILRTVDKMPNGKQQDGWWNKNF